MYYYREQDRFYRAGRSIKGKKKELNFDSNAPARNCMANFYYYIVKLKLDESKALG